MSKSTPINQIVNTETVTMPSLQNNNPVNTTVQSNPVVQTNPVVPTQVVSPPVETNARQSQLVQEIINEIQAQENGSTVSSPVLQPTTTNNLEQQIPENTLTQHPDELTNNSIIQTLLDDVKNNSKEIGLVTALTLLFSLPAVNDLIVKHVPQLTTENSVNTIGLVVKALLAGVLFFTVRKFL